MVSSSIYKRIVGRMEESIPFNDHVGIRLFCISDGVGEARLPLQSELLNHVETVHATAIFGVAEAASGLAMAGVFAADILKIWPVASAASVQYLKPAKTDLVAIARVDKDGEELRSRLTDRRKVDFDVDVTVVDTQDVEVARMTFAWHVRKRR